MDPSLPIVALGRLVESNTIGMVTWDVEGRIVDCNDAFLHIVAYDRDDARIAALRWAELTPVESREGDGRREADLQATGMALMRSREIGRYYKFTLLTENAFASNPAHRIGRACWDFALDLETEPKKWRLVRATLDARKPFRDFVYRSRRVDGSPMYVKASGKPVFEASGEFRGYRGTGSDVTATVRAQ